jgi:DivIVA domain-containing protein
MLFDEISLTPQDILEKEFKIDARGYRAQEVDKFLDMVISDYTKFISLIKKLEGENKDLIEESLELKQELRNYKDKLEILKEGNGKEITNVDLLKRISQLEKIVFKDND